MIVGPDFGSSTGREPGMHGRWVVAYGGPSGPAFSHNWRLEKSFLTSVQQTLDRLQIHHGASVIGGPTLTMVGLMTGGFGFTQAHLKRRLVWTVAENRLLAQADERTRLARDVRDHLGAQLTQINLWTTIAQAAANSPEELKGHLQRISESAQIAAHDMSHLVWSRRSPLPLKQACLTGRTF